MHSVKCACVSCNTFYSSPKSGFYSSAVKKERKLKALSPHTCVLWMVEVNSSLRLLWLFYFATVQRWRTFHWLAPRCLFSFCLWCAWARGALLEMCQSPQLISAIFLIKLSPCGNSLNYVQSHFSAWRRNNAVFCYFLLTFITCAFPIYECYF